MPVIKDRILALYGELTSAESLRPTEELNKTFSDLVQLSCTTPEHIATDLLSDEELHQIIPHLRNLCSEGESHLEMFWTNTIVADEYPSFVLEQFPYYNNYVRLTELEYRALSLTSKCVMKKILFVGCGPLPLSSILLAQKYGLIVDNIDKNSRAVVTSRKLVHRLGIGDVVKIIQADAASYPKYSQYDAIFLASLVGLDPGEKQAIIARIQSNMKEGGLLVVRTAHGLRTLLYPPVDVGLITGLTAQVIIQPMNEVVNSVIILEKPYVNLLNELVVEDKTTPQTALRFRQFCMEMISEVYHAHYDPAYHFDIAHAEDIYTHDHSNMFVIRHNDEVLAVAAIRPYDHQYGVSDGQYGERAGSIWRFFIKPQYEMLGLEERMQARIASFAASVGFTHVCAQEQRGVPGVLQKYMKTGYRVTYESNDRFGTVHFEKALETPRD